MSRRAEGFWPPNVVLSHQPGCETAVCQSDCVTRLIDDIAARERSSGSPSFSRLFYAAKAARAEREAGCERLEARVSPIFSHGDGTPRARSNLHPTVKPISLMRWIVRLVVPPGGVVLDPFSGSGSTGIAAVLEGRQFVGIEREPRVRPDRSGSPAALVSGGGRRASERDVNRTVASEAGLDGPAAGGRSTSSLLSAANAIQSKEVSSR